jgi:hypothetical protein
MGILLFGPGERLTDLMHVVQATSPRAGVRQIGDLDELAEGMNGSGTLLVDTDVLPAEDVGYLRRFLGRHETFEMTLVGEDSSRRVARTLLRRPRTRWMHWPPDLEDIRNLVSPAGAAVVSGVSIAAAPGAKASASPAPLAPLHPGRPHRTAPIHEPEADEGEMDELEEIEAILDLDRDQDSGGGADLDRGDEREDEEVEEKELPTEAGPPRAESSTATLPGYFRDQVADLADIAQRIEGGLSTVRDAGSLPEKEALALSGDVARLVQFTRTLSYLSAAPPQGNQVFDLSELIDTLVEGLPRKGPQSPRWLVRSNGPLRVRSDREILLQAFDALLFVAEKCSKRGEIVRVQATAVEKPSAPRARITIDFPSGPLAAVDSARAIEPYGLRRILPDLGPNALSAASGILAGQGGRLELRRRQARLTWLVELPLVV